MKAPQKSKHPSRTGSDLATEYRPRALSSEDAYCREEVYENITLTALTVKRENRHITKPCGRYLALSAPPPLLWTAQERARLLALLTVSLRYFLSPPPSRLLIAGLGNRRLTADALGPTVADLVEVSAAIPAALDEKFNITRTTRTAVCIPDVAAKTGIESVHTVAAAAELFEADAVLAFDALAAKEKSKLLSVIEITDTGTVPGGGVKSGSLALSRGLLGIPVVAVGVPTVVRVAGGCFLVPHDLEEGVHTLASLLAEAVNAAFSAEQPSEDPIIEKLFSEELA